MQKKQRYEVHTKYGWFSLDEGAYRDYLAGKLWIDWPPDKPETPLKTEPVPPRTSRKALELRDAADEQGVFAACAPARPPVPDPGRMAGWSTGELELSARSSNCLMRAGLTTFGALADCLRQSGGLFRIRNLGAKSEQEIRRTFIETCYANMLPYEKAAYWQQFVEEQPDPCP